MKLQECAKKLQKWTMATTYLMKFLMIRHFKMMIMMNKTMIKIKMYKINISTIKK